MVLLFVLSSLSCFLFSLSLVYFWRSLRLVFDGAMSYRDPTAREQRRREIYVEGPGNHTEYTVRIYKKTSAREMLRLYEIVEQVGGEWIIPRTKYLSRTDYGVGVI